MELVQIIVVVFGLSVFGGVIIKLMDWIRDVCVGYLQECWVEVDKVIQYVVYEIKCVDVVEVVEDVVV